MPYAGRVEVFHAGLWGDIDNTGWAGTFSKVFLMFVTLFDWVNVETLGGREGEGEGKGRWGNIALPPIHPFSCPPRPEQNNVEVRGGDSPPNPQL